MKNKFGEAVPIAEPTPADKTSAFASLDLLPLRIVHEGREHLYPWNVHSGYADAALPFGRCRIEWSPHNDRILRADCRLEVTERVKLNCIEVEYCFSPGTPDFAWVPHLRPLPDYVIADQIYRSPAVVVKKGKTLVSLIPDINVWSKKLCGYLDFLREAEGGHPILTQGLGHWKPHGHIFFKRMKKSTAFEPGEKLLLSHFLLSAEVEQGHELNAVAEFCWKTFAKREGPLPQAMPFDRYAKHACDRIFDDHLFHDFSLDGRTVSGMITQTTTSRKKPKIMNARETENYLRQQHSLVKFMGFIQAKIFTNSLGYKLLTKFIHAGLLKVPPMISYQSWFNQVRTSLGAYLEAGRCEEETVAASCLRMLELALAAPQENGCLPSVCLFPEGRVSWRKGTKAFEVVEAYHSPDAAVTGFHLLEWHELVRPDERILEKCRALADYFGKIQDETGAIPAWVNHTPSGFIADTTLARSASTAAPAMFLARLHRLEPNEGAYQTARKAAQFIAREVIPTDQWFDFELLYSCAGRPTGQDGPDPFTGVNPINTLSLYWAARAFLDLYLIDGRAADLENAVSCLDRLSMFQQVFDHPELAIDTWGGFGVMNADAEFNDARQGLFAPLYMDIYLATRKTEHFERGIAALRSCYTTMLVEHHEKISPGNMVYFRPSDRGAVLENYAHTGKDEVTAGYLSPDWGCGTSLYAAGYAIKKFGQVFVDVEQRRAFGIDYCSADFVGIEGAILSVLVRASGLRRLEVVIDDPMKKVAGLRVNGGPVFPRTDSSERIIVRLE